MSKGGAPLNNSHPNRPPSNRSQFNNHLSNLCNSLCGNNPNSKVNLHVKHSLDRYTHRSNSCNALLKDGQAHSNRYRLSRQIKLHRRCLPEQAKRPQFCSRILVFIHMILPRKSCPFDPFLINELQGLFPVNSPLRDGALLLLEAL